MIVNGIRQDQAETTFWNAIIGLVKQLKADLIIF